MSKCLVTKLKASVNNPDLPVVGAIRLIINSSSAPTEDNSRAVFKVGSTSTYNNPVFTANIASKTGSIEGQGVEYPYTLNFNENRGFYFYTTEQGEAILKNKYSLSGVQFGSRVMLKDVKDLYGIKLTEITLSPNQNGDKEVYKKIIMDNADTISIFSERYSTSYNGPLTKGDVLKLTNLSTIDHNNSFMFSEGFNLSWVSSTKLTKLDPSFSVKCSELAKQTSLSSIVFTRKFSGEIKDFITPWINSGRTSGKITAHFIMSAKVTYNGVSIKEAFPSVENKNGTKLSWTSDGTVTITNS